MRKRITLILVLLFAMSLFVVAVFAHPGDTDSNGGHVDRSTGEYHYHHGYSAHSHYDIDGDGDIDCPYDFKDKTGQNSGNSTGSTSNSYHKPNPSSDIEKAPDGGGNMTWTYWVMGGLVIVIFILSLVLRHRKKHLHEEIHRITEEHQRELQNIAATLTSFDKDLRSIYGIDYLCSAAGAPYGDSLDEDFLPISQSFPAEPWGKYTLYVPQTYATHSKYHYPNCRYAVGGIAKNALELHFHGGSYSSCKVCFSKMPDVSWAVKSRSYISFFLQYAPDSVTAKEARINNSKPNSYETKSKIASLQKALSKHDK